MYCSKGTKWMSAAQISGANDATLGRPRFNIPRNQLAFLLEARFSVPEILGVSVLTVG